MSKVVSTTVIGLAGGTTVSTGPRIWIAGPTTTVTLETPVAAALLKPQTPPRKSVVSVVHVCPLYECGDDVSSCATAGWCGHARWDAVSCRLPVRHGWEALAGPGLGDATRGPDLEAGRAHCRRVVLEALTLEVLRPEWWVT
jgi:hypothetical protein